MGRGWSGGAANQSTLGYGVSCFQICNFCFCGAGKAYRAPHPVARTLFADVLVEPAVELAAVEDSSGLGGERVRVEKGL